MESNAESVPRPNLVGTDLNLPELAGQLGTQLHLILSRLEAHGAQIRLLAGFSAKDLQNKNEIKQTLQQQQTQIDSLQQQINLINKTLRNVCLDTENPFYTKDLFHG